MAGKPTQSTARAVIHTQADGEPHRCKYDAARGEEVPFWAFKLAWCPPQGGEEVVARILCKLSVSLVNDPSRQTRKQLFLGGFINEHSQL